MFESNRFRKLAFILCVIYALFSLIIFSYQVYSFIEKTSGKLPPPIIGNNTPQTDNDILRGFSKDSPPVLVYSFFGMLISSITAVVLYLDLKKLEKREPNFASGGLDLQKDSIKNKLLPDEKLIVELLEQNNGEMAQSELVSKSGMNKLKVSRIVKKLEFRNLVKKHPYGMTNKVILEPDQI